jgi:ubiquinone/menaquinone biosynthesis C-methylase UbiE
MYGQRGPRFFEVVGTRLVALAGVFPGAHVLDVAAGRGAVLLAAAERVGPGGYVLGIDLAERMVQQTSEEIERRGLRNAEMRLMDAEQLELPDASFDFVLCSFALFFFPHLGQALSEFMRVLRPSGVLGVALGSARADPRWEWHNALVQQYAGPEPLPPAMLERSFHQPGDLTHMLEAAGFVDVREHLEDEVLAYRDEDEWWAALWTHGTRSPLERMTPDVLARFKAEAFAHLRELKQSTGLTQRLQFMYALAKKPRVA